MFSFNSDMGSEERFFGWRAKSFITLFCSSPNRVSKNWMMASRVPAPTLILKNSSAPPGKLSRCSWRPTRLGGISWTWSIPAIRWHSFHTSPQRVSRLFLLSRRSWKKYIFNRRFTELTKKKQYLNYFLNFFWHVRMQINYELNLPTSNPQLECRPPVPPTPDPGALRLVLK